MEIVGLGPLIDFCELCLWTGAVSGERPASCILVAAAGSGKSSVLEKLQCDAAPLVTDLTSREISAVLRENPGATHILLSDMMAIFSHRSSVVSLACSMLGNLTGDAARTDSFQGGKVEPRQLGLITAIPTPDFQSRKVQRQLNTAGFSTRFMIVRYNYSIQTILRIHEYIKSDLYAKPNGNGAHALRLPKKRIAISIPEELSEEIYRLATFVKAAEDEIGTRIHHHLRALVKARARRAGREKAIQEDMEAIREYISLFGPKGQTL